SVEISDLNAQLQEKVFVITTLKIDLRKLKGKDIVDNAAQVSNATTIAPGMFKIDPVILAPRDKNNRETHIYYLKHTMEQAAILREIVEQAKSLNPLDNASYTACKYVKLIQELLGYIRDTCPDILKPSDKLITVTPKNNVKKVRFFEPLTSSNNTQHVESSKTSDSNIHVLSSTRVKCSTSTCRSQPTSNKRNDRILQPSSSNIKNTVEAQPRKVDKKNRVVETICNANVKQTMLNANSQLICVTYMALKLMAKAFQLNNTTPTNNNQRSSSNTCYSQMLMVDDNVGNQNQNGLSVVLGFANQHRNGNVVAARAEGNSNGINRNLIRCYNCQGEVHYASNCTVKPRKKDAAYLQTQLPIAQKEEARIQLNSEEFDFMAIAGAYDEIEEVNVNCTLKDNLQQASTTGTQTDNAPIYDSDRLAKKYTELIEPIPEPHQVQQNGSNVISEVSSVEQFGGTVEQHPVTVEETRAYFESLYNNLAIEVEKVNTVNRKLREKKHDPPSVYDSEEILELAQESHLKMKQLNKEIKPANYTKINHLSGVFVSQTAKSREEFYFSNTPKTANVSKSISIPNEEFSDDTTPSVTRKFLNEKQPNLFETSNLLKEADESLTKHKALELEIERLLRAVVSQDIMSIMQSNSVADTSNL
ncbi:hypothetical protein Tco_0884967, partial [Tanacetum coccineum]